MTTNDTTTRGLLDGVRIIESSLLGPGGGRHAPRRPRRRGHQGREPGRRLRPQDGVPDRRRHLAAALAPQPGQAEHRARSAHRRKASRRTSTSCAAPTPSSRRCGPARWRGAVSATTAARGEPADRVLHDLGLRHDRPVQGHAEPRHRVRRLGRCRAADVRRPTACRPSRATRRSASTRARSTPRSASARPSSARAPRDAAAGSRWRRATRRRRSTGTASRATRPTSGPRTRSPATTATARGRAGRSATTA